MKINGRVLIWIIPLIFLVVLILGFGLLIPQLGFYWDDWPVIFLAQTQGAQGFWEFYQFDRPISAWTYIVVVPVFGTTPLHWHIFTLVLRWLVVVGMWWTLRGLWPQRTREVTWMALLFAVYPAFFQQSVAVAYSQHFITYGLFFLSLGAMVWAVRKPRHFWSLTILSLLTSLAHLLTMEYFVGLELLRPLLLWFLVDDQPGGVRERLKKTLKLWAPYLLVLVLFVAWRSFFLDIPDDPNAPRFLLALRQQPVQAGIDLIQSVLRDFMYMLLLTWSRIMQPELITLQDRSILFSWIVGIVAAVGLAFIMLRLNFHDEESQHENKRKWVKQGLILGAYAIFVGLLPVWFTGRNLVQGLYADRFALPALFGASITLVCVVELISFDIPVSRQVQKTIILSLLIGLSISLHIRTANNYRWDWVKQSRFYWQLHWRAPGIKPGTALVADGALSGYVSGYSAAAAVNTLYPQSDENDKQSYWFFEFFKGYDQRIPEFIEGLWLGDSLRSLSFSGSSRNSLPIYYQPEGHCLWVLNPRDVNNTELPEAMRKIVPHIDLDLIEPEGYTPGYPPESVFGSQPPPNWCYYYQKADLARQLGDWEQVNRLGREAQRQGHKANNGFEWLPFVEANLELGNWEDAHGLSLRAYEKDKDVQTMLCVLWDEHIDSIEADQNLDAIIASVHEQVGCPTP